MNLTKDEAAELLALLRDLEWCMSDDFGSGPICPSCIASDGDDHSDECVIDQWIKKLTP